MSRHLAPPCSANASLAFVPEQCLKAGDMAAPVGLSQSAYSRLEKGDSLMNLAQLQKVCAELGESPSAVLHDADSIEKQLKAQDVHVLPEKPDNAAAALVGHGLLATLLLSGSR